MPAPPKVVLPGSGKTLNILGDAASPTTTGYNAFMKYTLPSRLAVRIGQRKAELRICNGSEVGSDHGHADSEPLQPMLRAGEGSE